MTLAAIGDTPGRGMFASGLSPSLRMVRANASGTALAAGRGAAAAGAAGAAGAMEPDATGLPHDAQKRACVMRFAPHFAQLAMHAQCPTTPVQATTACLGGPPHQRGRDQR